MNILIGLGVILVAAILYLLFKVSDLLGIVKGGKPVWETSANKANAYLMVVFILLFMGGFWWYFFHSSGDLLPEASSIHGVKTDQLFYIATGIILVPFVVLNVLLFWAAFRFRYNKNKRASFYHDNNKLEMAWTIIPGIVFTVLILRGVSVWNEIKSKAPEQSEVIEVMGFQFGWKVRYPGADNILATRDIRMIDAVNEFGMDMTDKNAYDDFTSTEIHIPKGRPVLLKIWSRDVIHSVFAPHFRLKMDAVPGMGTQFWFTPTQSTEDVRTQLKNPEFNYEIACAEVCGRGHFAMRMVVVVDEPEAYEKWKKEQESWLKSNPDFMAKVPEELKELARIKSGLKEPKEILKASF